MLGYCLGFECSLRVRCDTDVQSVCNLFQRRSTILSHTWNPATATCWMCRYFREDTVGDSYDHYGEMSKIIEEERHHKALTDAH